MSDSLQPHGLQHTRLPCPSPSPRAQSNLCPLSQWCHPTISSSVTLFSSCLQYFVASGSFLGSRLFTSSWASIIKPCQGLVTFLKLWKEMLKWRAIFLEGYTSPLLPITSSSLSYFLKLCNTVIIIFSERRNLKVMHGCCQVWGYWTGLESFR